MNQRCFQDLLKKYVSGQCTEDEEKLVNEWFNRLNFPEGNQPITDLESIEIRLRLWQKISREANKRNQRQVFILYAVKVAAVLIVLFSIVFVTQQFNLRKSFLGLTFPDSIQVSVSNKGDRPLQVSLSDGSKVVLQPQSSIRYAKQFNSQRKIHLLGEASFHVVKDSLHPFIVYSNEVVTRVLGTSFTVKCNPNEDRVVVSVQSGKVSVFTLVKSEKDNMPVRYKNKYVLTPNQQVVFIKKDSASQRQLVERPKVILPIPTLTKVRFDGVEVNKIFSLLEQNFGVEIAYDVSLFEHCRITTSFNYEGLYQQLELICKAIDAQYTITDGRIVVTGHGCK
jgi:transmembrane sensor